MADGTQTNRSGPAPARPPAQVALPPQDVAAPQAARRCRSCCGMETLRRLGRVRQPAARSTSPALFLRDLHRADRQGRPQDRAVASLDAPRRTDARLRLVRLPARPCCCSPGRACTPTRAQRPGLPEDRLLAVPGDGRRAHLRASPRTTRSTRATTSSTARCVFAIVYVGGAPLGATSSVTGVAAARGRLPAPRGARRLGQAHRGRRARAGRRGPRAGARCSASSR